MSWNDWLNEFIEWDSLYHVPRRVAISRFVRNGLLPFIESKGYRVGCNANVLQSRIATGLYINQDECAMGSKWDFARINDDYLEHDIDHYWHVIDREAWDGFWEQWGTWTDVSLDSWRGPDRRMDIEHYMWTQINLQGSLQTQVVNERIGWYDDHPEDWHAMKAASAAAQEDVYMREARESGEWGGYRK
jgi:hypothetical protein